MTEDEMFEDIRFWKDRAHAAELQLWDAKRIIEDLLGLELGSAERALIFLNSKTEGTAK